VYLLWAHWRGDDEPARLGVTASRAVGSSVDRHRAKRMVREVFRRHQHRIPPGLDLVIAARSSLLRLSFVRLEERFLQSLSRLGEPSTHPS
jgi:ribonuclease P protein component